MILSDYGSAIVTPPSYERNDVAHLALPSLPGDDPPQRLVIGGPSGCGKRGLVSISLARRFSSGPEPLPVSEVRVEPGEKWGSLAWRCLEAVSSHDPGAEEFETVDQAGGGSIFTAVRGWAKRDGAIASKDGADRIRRILLVEGIDRMPIEADSVSLLRIRETARSEFAGLVRILDEIGEAGTTLIAVTLRTWLREDFFVALDQAGDKARWREILLTFPAADECRRIVEAAWQGELDSEGSHEEVPESLPGLVAEIAKHPAVLAVLPSILEEWDRRGRPGEKSALSGAVAAAVCRVAQESFWAQDVSRQKIWAELWHAFDEHGEEGISVEEMAQDGEWWLLALELTESRVLRMMKGEAGVVRFSPLHPVLLSQWGKAIDWRANPSPSLSLIRRLEDAAVAWEAGGRNPGRLLLEEAALARALSVAGDRILGRQMSPLCRDYLRHSRRKFRGEAWAPVRWGAGLCLAAVSIGWITFVLWNGGERHAMARPTVATAVPEISAIRVAIPEAESEVFPDPGAVSALPSGVAPAVARNESEGASHDRDEATARVAESRPPATGDRPDPVLAQLIDWHLRFRGASGQADRKETRRELALVMGKWGERSGYPEVVEAAWKIAFSPQANSDHESVLTPELRLLMARVAWRSGDRSAAARFLADEPRREGTSERGRSLLRILEAWESGDTESARQLLAETKDQGEPAPLPLPWLSLMR